MEANTCNWRFLEHERHLAGNRRHDPEGYSHLYRAMRAAGRTDKTSLFQAFETELRMSATQIGALKEVLHEAEIVLTPFFENPAILQKSLSAGALTYEASFLLHKTTEPWVAGCVLVLLKEFRAARAVNPTICFATWIEWMKSSDRAIANFATTAQLQGNKSELATQLLVKSYLRDAADILEGTLQTFARLRLKMIEIAGLRSKSHKLIEALSFGEVIDELVSVGTNGDMYRPQPLGVSLSQWRNIAHHNGFETKGNQVTCTYGQPSKQKSFVCNLDDIISLACYANDLAFAHKIAFEIFSIDNHVQILEDSPNIPISDYTMDSTLAFGLVSAGFSIGQAINDNGTWNLILLDEHVRNKIMVKAALQEACVSYLLMGGSCHIEASVRSSNTAYRIGFKASLSTKEKTVPDNFKGSIRKLDENFRIGPDEQK
jgi:hypothetical protein